MNTQITIFLDERWGIVQDIVFINGNNRKFAAKTVEGGLSRNRAWEKWLLSHSAGVKDLQLKKGKIIHNFQVYCALLLNRNKTIFFLYPVVGVPIFYMNFFEKILSRVFFLCVKISNRYNTVVFDISDLKYEQSIDLNLLNTREGIRGKEIEEKLFSTNSFYIFASNSMKKYACDKYNIDPNKADVCINGGSEIKADCIRNNEYLDMIDEKCINFVYAGTLNKGRQIEELISSFPNNTRIHLYLLGPNGEWINTERENISYLGPIEEDIAHAFVSRCDVGIIPYPTKLSFYITANLPFLSTPVSEVEVENEKINGGWLLPMKKWPEFFENIDIEDIKMKKDKIKEISGQYLWETIIRKNIFIK